MAEIQIIRGADLIVFDIFADFKLYGAAVLLLMTGDHRDHERFECFPRTGGNIFRQVVAKRCDSASPWKTRRNKCDFP